MSDGVITVPIPLIRRVAFLSYAQADHYGGIPEACSALGVDALAEPEILLERTVGELPWFAECGHA